MGDFKTFGRLLKYFGDFFRRGHEETRPASGYRHARQRDHDEGAALRPVPADPLSQEVRTPAALQRNAGQV